MKIKPINNDTSRQYKMRNKNEMRKDLSFKSKWRGKIGPQGVHDVAMLKLSKPAVKQTGNTVHEYNFLSI